MKTNGRNCFLGCATYDGDKMAQTGNRFGCQDKMLIKQNDNDDSNQFEATIYTKYGDTSVKDNYFKICDWIVSKMKLKRMIHSETAVFAICFAIAFDDD